jgi:assimilatory nitrate reductase catalytic subunit
MHWGSEYLAGQEGEAGVNALTTGACCPQSKQPELKHSAVKLEAATLPWRLLAAAWLPAAAATAARDALRALMPQFGFANVVPFGQQREGLLLRAAAAQAPDAAVLEAVEAALGLPLTDRALLRYADPARGQRRTLRLLGSGAGARLEAFVVTGDAGNDEWVRALLQDEQPAAALSRQLLSPAGRRTTSAPRRRQVCNCFDVDEAAINGRLAACSGTPEQRLAGLQETLRCGTQCGSCLPELRRLVRSSQAAA